MNVGIFGYTIRIYVTFSSNFLTFLKTLQKEGKKRILRSLILSFAFPRVLTSQCNLAVSVR
jgi:hypothetical protein